MTSDWRVLTRLSRFFGFARSPKAESSEHVGVGEKGITLFAKHRALDLTGHVTTSADFCGGNLYLAAVLVAILNRGAEDHAIDPGPEGGAHAHGAGFAGGVKGVASEGDVFQLLCCQSDSADFGVGAGVKLGADGV